MRSTVAKRLHRRSVELWDEHGVQESKASILINVINYFKKGTNGQKHITHTTSTIVKLRARRVYKNLKWLYKQGIKGEKAELMAMGNAIKWSKVN